MDSEDLGRMFRGMVNGGEVKFRGMVNGGEVGSEKVGGTGTNLLKADIDSAARSSSEECMGSALWGQPLLIDF